MGLQPPEQAHRLRLHLGPLDRHRQRDHGVNLGAAVGLLDSPDFSVESYEAHDIGGNLTLAAARARAHGAGSDTPIEQVFWQVVRWRRGRCFWWAHFDTRAEAVEAVGLSERDVPADS
jgi:hypothetical protein